MNQYWIGNAAQMHEFFKLCIEREAVTLEERLKIMDELKAKYNMDHGFTNLSQDELTEKLKEKGVKVNSVKARKRNKASGN